MGRWTKVIKHGNDKEEEAKGGGHLTPCEEDSQAQ
jgi:hypothetical protein